MHLSIGKSRRIIYKIITNPNCNVVYSKELLKEYAQVIGREKFNKIVKLSQTNRFIKFLEAQMIEVKVSAITRASRDKNDDYLLGLSKAAKADYLITGDLDLLVMKNYLKTRIVTMKEFVELTNY